MIDIICSNCRTAFKVTDDLAGEVFTCSRCQARIAIPAVQYAGGPLSKNPRFDRVLGRPAPIGMEILGLHTQWAADYSNRDLVLFLWSLRHIVLIITAFLLFLHYSANEASAKAAAPFFFWIGVVVLLVSWVQVNRISASLARNMGTRQSSSLLARILAAALLIVTDFRASLPALRTLLLALVVIFSGLGLAADSGSWKNVLPLPSFRHAPLPAPRPIEQAPEEAPPPPPPATAPAPRKPTADDLPLPPPEN